MRDITLAETCRIEGRCCQCLKPVIERSLGGLGYEMEDYRCIECGGSDSRVEKTKGAGIHPLVLTLIILGIGMAAACWSIYADFSAIKCHPVQATRIWTDGRNGATTECL
jgi:hypothetical protein